MEVSPTTSICDGAAAASVRGKRKRINQVKKETSEVYNGGVERCIAEGSGKNNQLRRNGGSTTGATGKRRTCNPSADSHSHTVVQKPHLQRQKNDGRSAQNHGRETRSRQDRKEVEASKRTASLVDVNCNQIRNAANRSNLANKSKLNGDKEESVFKVGRRRSSSDVSTMKNESPSSEPEEHALLDYPSPDLTDTSSTVSVSGDGCASDAVMAVEETRSDESGVGEGAEEMMTPALNESDETDPTKIHGIETEKDRQSENEQCCEEPALMCPGEDEEEMGCDCEEDIETDEHKKTDRCSVLNCDIEEEKNKNVRELKGAVDDLINKPSLKRVSLDKSRSSPNPASNNQPTAIRKQYPAFSRPISSPKSFHQPVTRVSDQSRHRRIKPPRSTLQCLVDLVMWRYVPKTALIFGSGTFLIVSSSFATNLDISFVSVISYLGLVYLGLIFLYKSFINKDIASGAGEVGDPMVGEQDLVWAFRLILPFVNEFLHKLTALFSGDPGTTMKVAAVLFVMARCGGSITIWKLIKFGFFAAFTLPKLCSSYSSQISGYGKFWVRRFQDAWKSCPQKKVVAFGTFSIVWSFSSVTSRIWAAFMLIAAIRYYQQSTVAAKCPEAETEDTSGANVQKQSRPKQPSVGNGRLPTLTIGMKKAR